EREIEIRSRFSQEQYRVLPILHHADNIHEWPIASGHAKALADRVLVRPKAAGHGLIHNRNQRRFFAVGFGEGASTEQRNSHRSEVRRVHSVEEHKRRLLARSEWTALDVNR